MNDVVNKLKVYKYKCNLLTIPLGWWYDHNLSCNYATFIIQHILFVQPYISTYQTTYTLCPAIHIYTADNIYTLSSHTYLHSRQHILFVQTCISTQQTTYTLCPDIHIYTADNIYSLSRHAYIHSRIFFILHLY